MPVEADWANEVHSIIRVYIHDTWTIEEYLRTSEQIRMMMLTTAHPVHLIFDVTDMIGYPRDIFSHIPTINSHILPGQGLVIGVKYSPYLKAIVRIAARVFPRIGHNLHFVQTLADAYALTETYETNA